MNTPMPSTSPVPYALQVASPTGGPDWALIIVGLIVTGLVFFLLFTLWWRVNSLTKAFADAQDAFASYRDLHDTEMGNLKRAVNARARVYDPTENDYRGRWQ